MSRLTVVGKYVDDSDRGGITLSPSPSEADTEDSEVPDSDREEPGSDGESDSETTLAARGITHQKLYTTTDLQSTLSLTPSIAGPQPEDTFPFPRQFDVKAHQEAVFVYPAPSIFKMQRRRYSKRELKEVCREFKLRKWKWWSWMDQELFQKWVFSEVGAVVARKTGG